MCDLAEDRAGGSGSQVGPALDIRGTASAGSGLLHRSCAALAHPRAERGTRASRRRTVDLVEDLAMAPVQGPGPCEGSGYGRVCRKTVRWPNRPWV